MSNRNRPSAADDPRELHAAHGRDNALDDEFKLDQLEQRPDEPRRIERTVIPTV